MIRLESATKLNDWLESASGSLESSICLNFASSVQTEPLQQQT